MNDFLAAELRVTFAIQAKEMVKKGEPAIWLISNDGFRLFEEPTWFIHSEYVTGRSPSPNTWAAAAYDLSVWLQYLQGRGIDWRDATEADRAQFAHDLSQTITKDGQEYDDKTINRYLSSVRRFYQFATMRRWYFGDIGTSMETVAVPNRSIDSDPLAHTRSPGGRLKNRDPLLRKTGRKNVVRPMQLSQLNKFLNYLGPDPTEWEGNGRRIRDRLIGDLGWQSGCRVGDVVGLTTLQILAFTVSPTEVCKNFDLIVEGKGKVTRLVSAPGWLILGLQKYIDTERAQSELMGSKRKGFKKSYALFLGHANSKSAGKPISRSAIQKMFSSACRACGITEQQEATDPNTLEKHVKTTPRHSFHDLRHNCAVLTYHVEKAMGNSEPWKAVQLVLGHKSQQITIDTYLAHVEIFGERQGVTDFRQLIRPRD